MSRFLRLALIASTAAAALSLTAAPAAPPPVPSRCALQYFAIGAMSTCDPGTVNTHQVELHCQLLGAFPYMHFPVWGPEAPHIPALHRPVPAPPPRARPHRAHPIAMP